MASEREKKTKDIKPMTLVEKWIADSKEDGGPVRFLDESTKDTKPMTLVEKWASDSKEDVGPIRFSDESTK